MPDFTEIRRDAQPLDFTEEFLEIGDTTAFLEKMLRLMNELQTFSVDINNTATDINLFSTELSDSAVMQARLSGYLTFTTQAGMNTYGAPPTADPAKELAWVWNDPDFSLNGAYGWGGSAWVKISGLAGNAYDIAVNSGFVGTKDQWLISLEGADGQHANMRPWTQFNGIDSQIMLDQTYSLQNVGDYIEVFIRIPTTVTTIADHSGIFGESGSSQTHTSLFQGSANGVGIGNIFSVRASDSTIVQWTIPTSKSISEGGFLDWVKIKLEVTAEGELTFYADDVSYGSKAVNLPFNINNFANAYGQYATFDLREVDINASEGRCQFSDPKYKSGIVPTSVVVNYEAIDSTGLPGDDGLNGLYADEKRVASFNGTSSEATLDTVYSLSGVGDFIEIDLRLPNSSTATTDVLGIFGTPESISTHVAGFLVSGASSLFSIRASTNTWAQWGINDLTVNDLVDNFKAIKLEVTDTDELSLYVDGENKGPRTVSLPFNFSNLANAYQSNAIFDLGSVKVQSSQGNFYARDFSQLSLMSEADVTLSIEYIPETPPTFSNYKIQANFDSTTNILQMYFPLPNGKFVEMNFKRSILGSTGANNENFDVWEMSLVWLCENDKTQILPYTQVGAWECAIKEIKGGVPEPDFIGSSAHGDDILSSYALMIDGLFYTDSSNFPTDFFCSKVDFYQTSTLYSQGTSLATVFGTAKRHWSFYIDDGIPGVDIFSEVTVDAISNIRDCYLSMVTVERDHEGAQITDTSVRTDGDKITLIEDVTTSGFLVTHDQSPKCVSSSLSSGLSISSEVVLGWDKPERQFNVSSSPSYNKHYYDYVGQDYTTAAGEVIQGKMKVRFGTLIV